MTCKILGTPTITRPTGVVDTTFSVAGTNGFQGAVVDIYTDLSNTHHGQAGVVTAPGWSRFITVDPGVVTLVAQQTIQGVSSLRGTPVTFKVRPSRLTSVSVTALADSGLRFSGAGHKNATVDVIKLSGPGSQTIPPVTVSNNGTWSVDSANWPLGRYSFKATQKVPDNIGGWIVSSEYTFSYTIELPRPTVDYTGDYTPVFSGTGYTGAAVVLYGPAGGNKVAPDAQVSGGRWSSTASAEWGPTFKRKVDLRQELNGHVSGWEELEVTIAPLPPVITEITGGDDSQLSPTIKGTCWIEAVVNLVYSDAPTIVHPVTMTNGNWTHRRATPFTPNVTHTVTVTQTAGQQTSLPASRNFQVSRALHKPVITSPVREAEVARDLTVRGQLGVAGASMQLRVDGINAAPPQQLITDGEWSIALTGLAFGRRIFDAQQTLDGRPSELSDPVAVMVVLMPPVFTVPLPGGKVPRAATIAGKGTPGAKVQVWEEGREDLLLMEVPVGFDGCWEGAVNLPVGVITLQARQTMEAQKEASGESSPVTCDVVPDAPWIETPVKDGEIGRVTVVSGFGEPGDTITISLDDAAHTVLGSTPVLEDRTWSVAVTLTQPAGAQVLVAVASLDGFESDRCARQPVVLGSYSPVIDTPQAGRWVAEPVNFSGQGRRGTGEVTSWYNPEYVWAPALAVSAQGWQGWSVRRLSAGGNWCRFKQTIVDGADGSTISDWVQSRRFEVPGPPPR
ncbi:hypothetical protein [Pseudomonas sp. ANT_J12]|uniref:hypothetical protein n=1 Tax=Pseudomonas sp. ANT_J12 TaxID=2597351 RepID=UPI002113B165|nr:hypothetical protein [Pseudomonas sp. ANT_J12]